MRCPENTRRCRDQDVDIRVDLRSYLSRGFVTLTGLRMFQNVTVITESVEEVTIRSSTEIGMSDAVRLWGTCEP